MALLQFVLQSYGFDLEPDGVFGELTESAVKDFQRQNGLVDDGIVGVNTWRTLLCLPPYPLLKRGARGAYVKFLQQKLESFLIPVGEIDGIFGAKTESAVRKFQQEKGLTVDGIVGVNTWTMLNAER